MNTKKKTELRQKYRALRDSFGEEFINKSSRIACQNLANCKEFIVADTVLLYYPIKNELSSLPMLELCLKMGKAVGFPVCQKESSSLIFKRVTSLDSLAVGSFELLEPDESCEILIPTKDTICIVPALAFSKSGHRLGYGKGFYDRFLANFTGTSVGFSYSEFVCDELPHDEHDIPLNMIVTEREVLRIAYKN